MICYWHDDLLDILWIFITRYARSLLCFILHDQYWSTRWWKVSAATIMMDMSCWFSSLLQCFFCSSKVHQTEWYSCQCHRTCITTRRIWYVVGLSSCYIQNTHFLTRWTTIIIDLVLYWTSFGTQEHAAEKYAYYLLDHWISRRCSTLHCLMQATDQRWTSMSYCVTWWIQVVGGRTWYRV